MGTLEVRLLSLQVNSWGGQQQPGHFGGDGDIYDGDDDTKNDGDAAARRSTPQQTPQTPRTRRAQDAKIHDAATPPMEE